jgi:butyryl-CoA dehydrogenase
MIRDTARQFARQRLLPHAARWDRESHFPMEEIREMGRLGLMGINVPVEWGGAGANQVSTAVALEEIAAGDAATSTVMSGHNSVGCMPIVKFGNDDQKRRFLRPMAEGRMLSAFALTEAQGGSDAAAMTTRAVRDGDQYVLNGTKQFITSGKNADVAIIFARTGSPGTKDGISAFIAPTGVKGYTVLRVESKLGQRASDTCEIALNDMRAGGEPAWPGRRGSPDRPFQPARWSNRHRRAIGRHCPRSLLGGAILCAGARCVRKKDHRSSGGRLSDCGNGDPH